MTAYAEGRAISVEFRRTHGAGDGFGSECGSHAGVFRHGAGKQRAIIDRTHTIGSKKEMQAFVSRIGRGETV